MLKSLFGWVVGPLPSVLLVNKAFEEAFMREPWPGGAPCAMGNSCCECMFIDKNAPVQKFVGVAFDPLGEAYKH